MIQIRDPERFAKIASGVQNIVLAIAILVGGFWTFFIFNAQLQVENSRAQVAKLKRELSEQANIEVKISARRLITGDVKARHIVGVITVKNYGNRIATLPLSDDVLKISRVSVMDDGKLVFHETTNVGLYVVPDNRKLRSIVAFPDVEYRVPFLAKVSNPGVYFVSFLTEKTKEEKRLAGIAGESPDSLSAWGDTDFVNIE